MNHTHVDPPESGMRDAILFASGLFLPAVELYFTALNIIDGSGPFAYYKEGGINTFPFPFPFYNKTMCNEVRDDDYFISNPQDWITYMIVASFLARSMSYIFFTDLFNVKRYLDLSMSFKKYEIPFFCSFVPVLAIGIASAKTGATFGLNANCANAFFISSLYIAITCSALLSLVVYASVVYASIFRRDINEHITIKQKQQQMHIQIVSLILSVISVFTEKLQLSVSLFYASLLNLIDLSICVKLIGCKNYRNEFMSAAFSYPCAALLCVLVSCFTSYQDYNTASTLDWLVLGSYSMSFSFPFKKFFLWLFDRLDDERITRRAKIFCVFASIISTAVYSFFGAKNIISLPATFLVTFFLILRYNGVPRVGAMGITACGSKCKSIVEAFGLYVSACLAFFGANYSSFNEQSLVPCLSFGMGATLTIEYLIQQFVLEKKRLSGLHGQRPWYACVFGLPRSQSQPHSQPHSQQPLLA